MVYDLIQNHEYQYQTVNDISRDTMHKGVFCGYVAIGVDGDGKWFLKFANERSQTWLVALSHIVEIGEVCAAVMQQVGPGESPRVM
jgi:hypothetical protein